MRRAGDRYYTKEHAIRSLLCAYPEIGGRSLGDPACGDGRMARLLAPRFQRMYLNDISPDVQADTHLDLVDAVKRAPGPVDWWVSNLPFFAAGDGARACLDSAVVGFALLVRCTFLETCGPSHVCRKAAKGKPAIPCDLRRCLRNGRKWLPGLPPTRILSIPRFSFTGDGKSDSAPSWWFLWVRGADGAYVPGTITVSERHTQQLVLAA